MTRPLAQSRNEACNALLPSRMLKEHSKFPSNISRNHGCKHIPSNPSSKGRSLVLDSPYSLETSTLNLTQIIVPL